MDSLTLIGHGIFFTFGVVIGATIMYGGMWLIELREEKEAWMKKHGKKR